MPSFATYTLGCKVNQAETARLEDILTAQGYLPVAFRGPADHYIINTCSVTHVADRKSRLMIRQCKRINPAAKVIVTGCFTKNKQSDLAALNIDHVVPNEQKLDLAPWQAIFPKVDEPGPPASPALKVRRMLKIQDGCSTFCSYCLVPYLRSDKTSLPLPEIISQAKTWTGQGARELVLTGVNLGNYYWQENNLLAVVRELSKINDLWRIRISSLELPDITKELIQEVRDNPKICEHLHLPLQSGSNKVLARMGRPYTLDDFQRTAGSILESIPDLALTTDIIVGFPGETKDDFAGTLRMIKEIGFSRLHVFKYSARPGTTAATLPEQVPFELAEERSRTLIDLGKGSERAFASRQLNRPVEVLFEEEKAKLSQGLTGNYVKIRTEQKGLLGKLLTVTPSKLGRDNILSVG